MLEKTFSLLYYLKKPKGYSKGLMPIYLRITVDGIAKEITTGRECLPERWNSRAGRMMGTKEDANPTPAVTWRSSNHNSLLRNNRLFHG